MKQFIFTLAVAFLLMASPAYAEAEANLSLESASMLIFNTIDITASYTEDSETIQGASCSLASAGLWETAEMTFDEQTGLFEFDSPMAEELGEYMLTLTCGAENHTTEQAEATLWVTEPANRRCGLEVDNLEAEGNSITGTVKNTGSWKQGVQYNTIINGYIVDSQYKVMEPGETVNVDNSYSFGQGTYNVRLEASADCGSYDKEDTGHFVLVPYSCYGPYGSEGQEYCDYGSKTVRLCSNSQWITSSVEYCYSCGANICGDGNLNCGETKETCYQDWQAQERTAWDSTHCRAKYLNEYRCDGDMLQREYRENDCDTEWKDYNECEYGCDYDECEPVCEVSIEAFDYNSMVPSNQMGYVTVSVKNLGEDGEEVDIILYMDGSRKSERTVELDEDETADRTIYYTASPGTHSMRVLAMSECGAAEDRYAEVFFQERSTSAIQESVAPVAEVKEDTKVVFGYGSLDMMAFSSKVIPIEIETSEPQDFALYVSGVPSDWVSHESVKHIENSGKIYVYLTAKEVGPKALDMKVVAMEEGRDFTHTIDLYVAGEEQSTQPMLQDGITGNIVNIPAAALTLTDSPVLALIVAVIFFLALGFGLHHLKESEWDVLEAKYRSNKGLRGRQI